MAGFAGRERHRRQYRHDGERTEKSGGEPHGARGPAELTHDRDGDLTLTNAARINGGGINVTGDVTTTDTNYHGTATIVLSGDGDTCGEAVLSTWTVLYKIPYGLSAK